MESYNFSINNNQMDSAFEILKFLQDKDQLNLTKYNNEYLRNYQEASINFPPTYKYEINSQEYNKSKKQRTPSWFLI